MELERVKYVKSLQSHQTHNPHHHGHPQLMASFPTQSVLATPTSSASAAAASAAAAAEMGLTFETLTGKSTQPSQPPHLPQDPMQSFLGQQPSHHHHQPLPQVWPLKNLSWRNFICWHRLAYNHQNYCDRQGYCHVSLCLFHGVYRQL